MNLELGQSLILAGLSSKSEVHTRSGLPGLSQIPLLGLLFGSERSATQDLENIVMIVSSEVASTTEGDNHHDVLQIWVADAFGAK